MRHIIPISGKDSLATALVQLARQPELPYEFVFNPTGLEYPELFDWIDRVEKHIGKPIVRVGRDLKTIIENYNYFLPSGRARYCTKESKIQPFVEWIGNEPCTVYYGIRADENREGFNNTTAPHIISVYPLQELGFGLNAVLMINQNAGLKPPTFFWESLYEEVKRRLGFDPRKVLPEYIFDLLFAWRTRTNCFLCFNQRYYEWVGLFEHYPDLFWEAEAMEHKGGEKTYTWNANKKSLRDIYNERDRIKKDRQDKIIKTILRYQQKGLFEDESNNEIVDFLSVKSCGLFCGK